MAASAPIDSSNISRVWKPNRKTRIGFSRCAWLGFGCDAIHEILIFVRGDRFRMNRVGKPKLEPIVSMLTRLGIGLIRHLRERSSTSTALLSRIARKRIAEYCLNPSSSIGSAGYSISSESTSCSNHWLIRLKSTSLSLCQSVTQIRLRRFSGVYRISLDILPIES